MSDDVQQPKRRSPWPRRIAGTLALLAGLCALALVLLDSPLGHRFVADRIAALEPANGLRYRVGRIEGSLFGKARLIEVRLFDRNGLVFQAPQAELDWNPFAWSANTLAIRRLIVPRATLAKLPELTPTGRTGPILPGFDIAIGELRVDRLDLAAAVTGRPRTGRLVARADIRGGRAMVDLAALVEGSDFVRIDLDAQPDRDRFDLRARARGRADGVLAKLTGIARPLSLTIAGDGRWSRWQGRVQADAGDERLIDLALGNEAGRYTLGGTVAPQSLLRGRLQRLTSPRILVNAAATLADRRLDGNASLRTPSLDIETTGEIDLARSAFRNLRTRARLLRPPALFPNMTGRNVELRAILDGAFATARFDYRITADRFAFDATGFEGARAAGRGRLSKAPVTVPVAFTARRVTGVGDVAGGILQNLSVSGNLRVTPTLVLGDDLRLRSDKLDGRIMLMLDLTNGRYEVSLNGGLNRYLIPGLGIVDVQSRLTVMPGPGGRGTRVVGTGVAQMVRLDNAFFRSLTGGLPRIVARLERGPDRVLYFRDLVLTSPDLTLRGNGYRRTDGSFFFEGSGEQATYGPVTVRLDGRIDRPVLDLTFASPQATLGLAGVTAHLDPTPAGYAFTAQGGSRLGPFTARGRIDLPRGGSATVIFEELRVSGTRATGQLAIVPGGFDGRLDIDGGGLSGMLRFVPVNGVQRIEGDIDARAAALAGVTVRRASLAFATLLDPGGTTLEATVAARGLRASGLTIGRLAASAKLTDGVGEITASFSGQRGRAFDLQSVTRVSPDQFRIQLKGSVDQRPLALDEAAVVSRDGDGWRLAPVDLSFAGGTARLGGRVGPGETSVEASVARLPLAVLDILLPGAGLSGAATGKLSYTDRAGVPDGRIDMRVRGLSRAGLVLSSRPVDLGIAGVIDARRAGFRAVVASDGRIIGRAQARMAPLGPGALFQRIANAPLFAQVRYDGPADTLWRLTGIELFDLSGPVGIAADVGGRLADPRIRGTVVSKTARIESAVTGTVLTNVQTRGRFNGSRLVIDEFSASDGREGSVSGSGAFDLSAASGFAIDLNLQARNAVMINRDDIGAAVTGPITIRSDGNGGTIGGDVRLDRSRYRLGQAVTAAAIPRLNIREVNQRGPDDEEDIVPVEPWRLDLRARAPGGLFVTGLGLSSEWSTDIQIGGEPTNPKITGRADLVRGDYEFAGRTFDLDRGAIRFDGSVPANPSLDIAANADTQGLNATIRVTGTALRPEIGFSSIPALPEDELLSRLLFGTSITQLSAPEALQLAAAVAALQDGGDGLNPINAVRRAAGLDRLRILPADPQTGQGTAIAAGKYLTRRTYVEIISDGQGYSATRVEFQLTRWLSLLSSISTIGRQSANIRVSRDY
ncbi:translocation/assembly module TamB domain-containing protein [Sphingomonas japonica]|uniref:Translocation and assembly module TamB n=1 Tax=Sphingomonas japonica TaxID=511662 RepID=A0ABX0U4P0_9SPHN|nr:translocation/assembly module TamB [Sphingomonas japonica]NIJ23762.1 translocation and assembly module TamB [Sphingomonas japonica]